MTDDFDHDHTPVEDDTASKKSSPKKVGFFTRLFGAARTGNELNIAIAPFIDATGQDHSRRLAAVLQSLEGVIVKTFRDEPLLNPEVDRAQVLPAACAQAMGWVSSQDVDLVLWGDIPSPGTTFFIHFAAPPPIDKDTAGTISPFQSLNLPVGFDPENFGGLLVAAALAAIKTTKQKKSQTCQHLVAHALEQAAHNIDNIPSDFTMREQASVQAAFGNALATFGHLFPGGEVYTRAAQAYEQAIKGTVRTENPANWAYLQRNLGTVLQALSERADDIEMLNKAVTAYRAALEVFSRATTPFPWATTQNRLGEVLYRLDIESGDTAGLKEALTVFQHSLKVLTLKSTPLLWSDTLNNLGQVAQVLGRELGNTEVIERAVTACQQALKVRTREAHPTLWAATQNTMGSALFLLGRITHEDQHYEAALAAFMGARDVYETLGLSRMAKQTERNIQHAEARLPEKTKSAKNNDPAMWWLAEDDDDEATENGPNENEPTQ